MTREYTRRPDLYDIEHVGDTLPGEIDFYRALAVESGGPVLELGFGTGRVGLEIARAGIEVYGLDLSTAMLGRAREKLAHEPDLQVTLIQGKMDDFTIDRHFKLIYVPFRAFLHLHGNDEHRAALRCVHRHLAPGGRFAGNFFRPKPAMLQAVVEPHIESIAHHEQRTYVRSSWSPRCDAHDQLKEIVFHTRVYAADGHLEDDRIDFLELDWIHGREWRLLLELENFELERLDGGFNGESPREHWEYVWVARAKT